MGFQLVFGVLMVGKMKIQLIQSFHERTELGLCMPISHRYRVGKEVNAWLSVKCTLPPFFPCPLASGMSVRNGLNFQFLCMAH